MSQIHNNITFLIDVQPIRDTTNKVVNNFKRADFLGAKEHLSNITWENEFFFFFLQGRFIDIQKSTKICYKIYTYLQHEIQ